MKIKRLFLALLFLPFLACDSDDSDGNGGGTSDVTFKANGLSLNLGTQVGAVYSDQSSITGTYQLTFTAGNAVIGSAAGDAIVFIIIQNTPITAGTYAVTGPVVGNSVTAGYTTVTAANTGSIYSATSGSITISSIDLTSRKMSGTFNFTFEEDLETPLGASNFDDTVQVTEGVFDNVDLII